MKKGARAKKKIIVKKRDNPKEEIFKKRLFFIARIIFSVILGFLPSFLYVALFVQYGSPFSNYLNFLSNFSSSFWAWISAVIIAFLMHFIWGVIKNFKKVIEHKFLLIIFILSILIVLFLAFVQSYLYVNFVLGSDVLVKLSADKDNIFFINNPQEDITFKISVIMNPFCLAQCKYDFFDISKGENIKTGFFDIASVLPKLKTYTLINNNLVQGSQELRRFEVSCKSKRTLFCYTREQETKRAVLISLNYELSPEDAQFKNDSKEGIISLSQTLSSISGKLNESKNNINLINNSFSTEDLQQLESLSGIFNELNNSLLDLKELWENQDFSSLRTELLNAETKTQNLNVVTNELNSNIILNISFYNNLTENLTSSRKILKDISQMNLDTPLCSELNNVILDFNNAVKKFKENSNLSDKKIVVEDISLKIKELYEKTQISASAGALCVLKKSINEEDLIKIEPISSDILTYLISLKEPASVCCFFGKCEKCCDDSCSKTNYPIIFLHGHSFSKSLPTDYSLDSFMKIKGKFADKDYIDAGSIILSPINEKEGLWGKVNAPIAATASYFFDTYRTETGEQTIPSNTGNIDTYAIRLKDIVELLKYRTNKDKVIILAHSMGGLVTRRYIQIFGAKDVDKIILISVPNHGVEDKVTAYCAVFGSEAECSDVDKNSILINKLNNAPSEKVPTYNIVGTGCNMGSETGDGIIKNSSQYLGSAVNYYIKGKCNELAFDFFHETILYPEQYPETYDIIKEILNNSAS